MPDPLSSPALLAALREAVARGMGHWRVDKLLEAVERKQKEASGGNHKG